MHIYVCMYVFENKKYEWFSFLHEKEYLPCKFTTVVWDAIRTHGVYKVM